MLGWAGLARLLFEMIPTFWLTYVTRAFVRSGQRALFAVVCVIVGVAGVVALAVLVLLLAVVPAVITAYLSARRPIEVRPLEALRND